MLSFPLQLLYFFQSLRVNILNLFLCFLGWFIFPTGIAGAARARMRAGAGGWGANAGGGGTAGEWPDLIVVGVWRGRGVVGGGAVMFGLVLVHLLLLLNVGKVGGEVGNHVGGTTLLHRLGSRGVGGVEI